MTITYGLMEKFEDFCKKEPNRAKLMNKSKVTDLISDDKGNVIGVKIITKDGIIMKIKEKI